MKNINKFALASLISAAVSSSAFASCGSCGCSAKKDATHNLHIGIEGGLSIPMQNDFETKKMKILGQDKKIKGHLNQSKMFGALVGYEFYPGMYAELSYQRKPFYKSRVTTPELEYPAFNINGLIPVAAGKIKSGKADFKLSSDLYMLGVVYDLTKVGNFTPYLGVELGTARVRNTATTVKVENPLKDNAMVVAAANATGQPVPNTVDALIVKKNSMYVPAAQVTLGITTDEIVPNVQLYGAVRAQIIKDAKIKYDMVNPLNRTKSSGKFKQTIGVNEIVGGITYNFPIKK